MAASTGLSYTIPGPKYFEPASVQHLKLVGVDCVRQGHGKTTPAWELTFEIPSLKHGMVDKGIRAGMQIGLLPVNDTAKVKHVLKHVKEVPQRDIQALLPRRGNVKFLTRQRLSPQSVLAHTIDLTRPTPELFDYFAFRWQKDSKWDSPVETAIDWLKGQPKRSPEISNLFALLQRYKQKGDSFRDCLQRLAINDRIRFSDYAALFQEAGFAIETVKDCHLSVADLLALPNYSQTISFAQLINNQPLLENRKYTPSEVDVKKGTIKILLSEVHSPRHKHAGSKANILKPVLSAKTDETDEIYLGTTTEQLVDMAHKWLEGDRAQTIQGFLDIRHDVDHKLPYDRCVDHNRPMILLSTGVGVAPHLAMLREAKAAHKAPNVAMMLSGVRDSEIDELLADEIKALLPEEKVYRCVTSADGVHAKSSRMTGTHERYVQHVLKAESKKVWDILNNKKGAIYICGWDKMREEVESTLKDIAKAHGHVEDVDAWMEKLKEKKEQFFESTSDTDRFYKEKWGAQKKERARIQQTGRG